MVQSFKFIPSERKTTYLLDECTDFWFGWLFISFKCFQSKPTIRSTWIPTYKLAAEFIHIYTIIRPNIP